MNPLLSIFFALVAAISQAPAVPPMKMGLWESSGTMTAKDGKPMDHVTRSCVTSENWLTLMGPKGPGACPKVNEVWAGNSYRFDVQCAGKPKLASVSVIFDSSETDHMTMDMFSGAGDTSMHATATSQWKGSECGDVSPDAPVLVSGDKTSHKHGAQ